jgi:hypothetical protein
MALSCGSWQDLSGNLVFAECGLVPPKTEAPQPDHNVHDGRPQSVVARIICRRGESVQGGVQVFKAFASLLGEKWYALEGGLKLFRGHQGWDFFR